MRTRLYTAIAASLMMSGAAIAEDTVPLNAVNKAGEVIDAAIEAYGGAEAITNLNSVVRKSAFTTWATNQSKKPGPPWDESTQKNFQAVDFENKTFVAKQKGSQGGFDFTAKQIIKDTEGWNIDYRAGTVTEQASPNFNNSSGPMIRVTAPLLVKQLQDRRHTSHWLGETEFNGRPHDMVTLVMEVGPALTLYFDQETHMLSRSERVLPPFGQVDYRFADYQEIDGIPFASSFELYANDQPNLTIKYTSTEVNKAVAQYAEVPAEMQQIAAVANPTEVTVNEVKEGIFLVGAGGTYAMFVEMDDHIVAVGGTAGIPDRIAKIRETVQDKPIKYAVLTHHHNDHLMGVPAWEKEGSVVLTVKENEEVVRNTAADGDSLKLKFVEDKYVFDGGRELQILNIGPTPHVDNLLVAFLPDEGVIFEADHFPNPVTGQVIPAQPVTIRLAEAMEELGMDVKYIIGAHSPRVATIEDLRKSLGTSSKMQMTASP